MMVSYPMRDEDTLPRLESPRIEPESMLFDHELTVIIRHALPDVTIHYTLDGSRPTRNSPVYSEPLVLKRTTTVKAMAVLDGCISSPVSSKTFSFVKGLFDSTNLEG